jgi:hypothetical protein
VTYTKWEKPSHHGQQGFDLPCHNVCFASITTASCHVMDLSHRHNRMFIFLFVALLTLCLNAPPCRAQTSGSSFGSAIADYFADWFPRVTRIQNEQPHWITPVVTVTPRLEEEFRYDQSWQANQKGVSTDNFGLGKGLELMPFQNTEVILGIPNWVAHNGAIQRGKDAKTDGWADETFL